MIGDYDIGNDLLAMTDRMDGYVRCLCAVTSDAYCVWQVQVWQVCLTMSGCYGYVGWSTCLSLCYVGWSLPVYGCCYVDCVLLCGGLFLACRVAMIGYDWN